MATFFLLPPRAVVGRLLASHLRQFLPALIIDSLQPEESTVWLESLASKQTNVYLVFRDELPFYAEPLQALIDGYGAEPDDEIIEVKLGIRPAETTTQSRRVQAA